MPKNPVDKDFTDFDIEDFLDLGFNFPNQNQPEYSEERDSFDIFIEDLRKDDLNQPLETILTSSFSAPLDIQVEPSSPVRMSVDQHLFEIQILQLIANLESALINKQSVMAQNLLENSQLKDLFCFKTVGTSSEFSGRILYRQELITILKAALLGKNQNFIQLIFDNNALLKNFFMGQLINAPVLEAQSQAQQQTWQLTLPEIMDNLKAAATGGDINLIKFIINNNPLLLLEYWSGKAIQVGYFNAQGQLQNETWQLTLTGIMDNFKAAIRLEDKTLSNLVVINNPWLITYWRGNLIQIMYPINGLSHNESQILRLTMPHLIDNFKLFLGLKYTYLIESIWADTNSPLHAAIKKLNSVELTELTELVRSSNISGKSSFISSYLKFIGDINASSSSLKKIEATPNFAKIRTNQIKSLPTVMPAVEENLSENQILQLITDLESALVNKNHDVAKDLFKNKLLKDLLRFKPVGKTSTSPGRVIFRNELFSILKASLIPANKDLILLLFEKNPLLINFFIGKQISLPALGVGGQIEWQIWQLTFPEIMDHFKAVMRIKDKDLINLILDNNPSLKNYLRGKAIQVDAINTQGQIESQIWQLNRSELVDSFKLILSTGDPYLIQTIWAKKNSPLQLAIKTLDTLSLIQLTEKVLLSNSDGQSKIIIDYLNSIDDIEVLTTCLQKLQDMPSSENRQKRIELLHARLKSIQPVNLSSNSDLAKQGLHQYSKANDDSTSHLKRNGFFSASTSSHEFDPIKEPNVNSSSVKKTRN
jgi:hypothetical protein